MRSTQRRRSSFSSRKSPFSVCCEAAMQQTSPPSQGRHMDRRDSEHISLSPSGRFGRSATPIQPGFPEAAETYFRKGLRLTGGLVRKGRTLRCEKERRESLEVAGRNPRFTLGTTSPAPSFSPPLSLQRFPERKLRCRRHPRYLYKCL